MFDLSCFRSKEIDDEIGESDVAAHPGVGDGLVPV
jgi:hypothetical protein